MLYDTIQAIRELTGVTEHAIAQMLHKFPSSDTDRDGGADTDVATSEMLTGGSERQTDIELVAALAADAMTELRRSCHGDGHNRQICPRVNNCQGNPLAHDLPLVDQVHVQSERQSTEEERCKWGSQAKADHQDTESLAEMEAVETVDGVACTVANHLGEEGGQTQEDGHVQADEGARVFWEATTRHSYSSEDVLPRDGGNSVFRVFSLLFPEISDALETREGPGGACLLFNQIGYLMYGKEQGEQLTSQNATPRNPGFSRAQWRDPVTDEEDRIHCERMLRSIACNEERINRVKEVVHEYYNRCESALASHPGTQMVRHATAHTMTHAPSPDACLRRRWRPVCDKDLQEPEGKTAQDSIAGGVDSEPGMRRGSDNLLIEYESPSKFLKAHSRQARPVEQVCAETLRTLRRFASIHQAADHLGTDRSTVCKHILQRSLINGCLLRYALATSASKSAAGPQESRNSCVDQGALPSRMNAVVHVLQVAGKALHYKMIARRGMQRGWIRFTGSRSTSSESLKAFLNKSIRQNKDCKIVNLGQGVYGLREWNAIQGLSSREDQATIAPECYAGAGADDDCHDTIMTRQTLPFAATCGSKIVSPAAPNASQDYTAATTNISNRVPEVEKFVIFLDNDTGVEAARVRGIPTEIAALEDMQYDAFGNALISCEWRASNVEDVERLYPLDHRLIPHAEPGYDDTGQAQEIRCQYCSREFPSLAARAGHLWACKQRPLPGLGHTERALFGRHGAVRLEKSEEEVKRPVSTIRRPRNASPRGSTADEPSDYEKKRLANIARNKLMLVNLGITTSPLCAMVDAAEGEGGSSSLMLPRKRTIKQGESGAGETARIGAGGGGVNASPHGTRSAAQRQRAARGRGGEREGNEAAQGDDNIEIEESTVPWVQRPMATPTPWTAAEDALLAEVWPRLGSKWSEIAGRSSQQSAIL